MGSGAGAGPAWGCPSQVVSTTQGVMAFPQRTPAAGVAALWALQDLALAPWVAWYLVPLAAATSCTCRVGGILPPCLSDSAFLFVF